jgi:hypothetical protein
MTRKYLSNIPRHPNQAQAEQVGKIHYEWPNAYANTFGTDPGDFQKHRV